MAILWPNLLEQAIAEGFATAFQGVDYAWRLPLSSDYGGRIDPITRKPKDHLGIDIPLPRGTGVLAVYNGRIERIDRMAEVNGNAVFLAAHPWRFCYLHLDEIHVELGQVVERGELLGTVGATGRATGNHLHFQVYLAGALIDPLVLFPGNLFRRVRHGK